MRTSPTGLKLITQREGRVLKVYRDSKGLPTAGVGHLLTVAERVQYPVGTKISQQQCDTWLTNDLRRCEDAINALNAELHQNEFDALVSLAFNIGVKGFTGSSVAKRLRAGDHSGAAKAILLWNKPPEIRKRRQGEYRQFLTPYKDSAAASQAQTPTGSSEQTTEGQKVPFDNQTGQAADTFWTKIKSVWVKADSTGDQIQAVSSTVEKFNVPQASSLGTRLGVLFLKFWATILMIGGMLYQHREYLYIAVILALAGALWWNLSRHRNAK